MLLAGMHRRTTDTNASLRVALASRCILDDVRVAVQRTASFCRPGLVALLPQKQPLNNHLTPCRPTSGRSPRDTAKLMSQLQELVQEAFKLSTEAGPKGIIRGIQAGQAVLEVGRDYIASGQVSISTLEQVHVGAFMRDARVPDATLRQRVH